MSEDTSTIDEQTDTPHGPSLGEQAVEGYHQVEQRVTELRDQATAINHQAVDFIKHNPGIAVAGAFGIGYLLGSMAARRWII